MLPLFYTPSPTLTYFMDTNGESTNKPDEMADLLRQEVYDEVIKNKKIEGQRLLSFAFIPEHGGQIFWIIRPKNSRDIILGIRARKGSLAQAVADSLQEHQKLMNKISIESVKLPHEFVQRHVTPWHSSILNISPISSDHPDIHTTWTWIEFSSCESKSWNLLEGNNILLKNRDYEKIVKFNKLLNSIFDK